MSKSYKVQFYSNFAQKFVTISSHRKLSTAVAKARNSWINDGYNDVSILIEQVRLDRYGSRCYFCNDSICKGSMDNKCQK